jgi:hypothetical protein
MKIGDNRQSIYTQGIHSTIHLYLFVSLKRSMALLMGGLPASALPYKRYDLLERQDMSSYRLTRPG